MTESRIATDVLIVEAIEEIALAEAIQDGRKSDFVERDRIFELLEGAA